MKINELNKIISPGFLIALLILILNDFYLKYTFPGFITGKVSDFAGLFIFPLFLSVFISKRKNFIYVLTAIVFIVWKTPLVDSFINFWNSYLFFKITRVVDYTDYYALIILPFSHYYKAKPMKLMENKFLQMSIICLSLFVFLATAGTIGNIKQYSYSNSKPKIRSAINKFYNKYPEYAVPKELKVYTFYHGDVDTIKSADGLSLNRFVFDFFINVGNKKIIIHTAFEGGTFKWKKKYCMLGLLGYVEPGKKWKFNHLMTREEKKWIKKLFEDEILSKINKILESQ